MSERNAMHALAAGRIVGEVIKRVAEGDHPTTPAFTNEILEDALIEVHRLFTAEQAQLATAQERLREAERLLRGALSEIVVTDATATMYGEIDTWLAGAREGA